MSEKNQYMQMIISAANNLFNNKEMIDKLNVFPVPDGDTGKNMYLTMSGAADAAQKFEGTGISKATEAIATATLKSARGNSGVILSQLFRGISKAYKTVNVLDPKSMAAAFTFGSETAYLSVMKPTEGTILTVARETAAAAKGFAEETDDLNLFFAKAVQAAKESLSNTPNLLPALKEAGVVDSGGMGWVCLLEGMAYYLANGEVTAKNEQGEAPPEERNAAAMANVEITFTYCTEFLIQKENPNYDIKAFGASIEKIGDSMALIDDFDIIKVHIHTDNPGTVLQKALAIGSLSDIKIDNMRFQHSEIFKELEPEVVPPKSHALVSVSSGDGFDALLAELGVDFVIAGGQTMNPSTGDILDAVQKVNAEVVYVLPNNKNIILAAEQAKKACDTCKIEVVPSKSIPQGISAIIAFDPEFAVDQNMKNMKAALNDVETGLVTYAVRNTRVKGMSIKEGDIIGIHEKDIVAKGETEGSVAFKLCDKMVNGDHAVITIYYGNGIEEEAANRLVSALEEKYPDLEIMTQYGGQEVYYYIISVE